MQSFGNARGLRRVQGSFFFSPDFRWYPFDRQRIEITVEQIEYPVTTWGFLPDWHLNGVSSTVRFPGWQSTLRDHGTDLANCGADVDTRALPGAIKMGHSKFSNLTFSTFTYRVENGRPIMRMRKVLGARSLASRPCQEQKPGRSAKCYKCTEAKRR